MVILYEAAVAIALVVVLRWLYRLWRGSGGSRSLGIAGLAAALAAFFWPWAWYADWAVIARVALVGGIVGALVLGYARLLARARAAAEAREEREP